MSRSRLSIAEPSHANGALSQANTGRSRARSAARAPPARPSKRIILCEDGTWLNSDNNSLKDALSIPSNITRLSRAIKSVSSDGIPQIVYYHFGVGGSSGSFKILNRLAGFNGDGIGEIIREGYEFVCNNYSLGDEIFLFGFSRGAYTARSIAGLIDNIGVLTKDGLPYLAEIYRDVKNEHDENYRPRHPDIPFPDKPPASDPAYKEQLQRRRMTILDVRIKVVGVWDTVGALGVPKVPLLTRLRLQSTTMHEFRFHDTALCDCVEYAFQALSLDERRASFQPCLWEKLEDNQTNLRQVWFPGAHSNIGGGYDDQQIATITFAWMVAQCQPFLDFDLDYVIDQWEDVEDYEKQHEDRARPWSFGTIFSGVTASYAALGTMVRKPGRYTVMDPVNGKETNEPLIDTREYIHPCVRARIKLKGPGIDDKGDYECKALVDWKLVVENDEGAKRPSIYWRARDKPPKGFPAELPEAPLKPLELELLEYDKETFDYVTKPSGVKRRSTQKRRSRSDDGR